MGGVKNVKSFLFSAFLTSLTSVVWRIGAGRRGFDSVFQGLFWGEERGGLGKVKVGVRIF